MRQARDRGREIGMVGALRRRLAAAGTFSLYALHRFNRDGCFAASGALSYTTLVSLVPLGVIVLGILSVFPNFAPVRQELLGLIFRNFVPAISEQAAWWFEYLAGSAAQATAIGVVGIAGTGILLLVTVEDQLNALWRVTTRRRTPVTNRGSSPAWRSEGAAVDRAYGCSRSPFRHPPSS